MKKKIEIYLMTYGQDKRGRNHYVASFYEPEPSELDMLPLVHTEKKTFYVPEGVELVEKHHDYDFVEYKLIKEFEIGGEKTRRSGNLEYDGKRVYIAWGGHEVDLQEVDENE